MAKADHTFHSLGKLWTLSTVALVLTQLAWFFLLQREQLNHSETVITGHDSGNQPLKLSTWSLKWRDISAPCSTLIFARFSFLLGWKTARVCTVGFIWILSWLPFDSFCARLMGWVCPALLSWPDLIKSATSHQKMLQHGQLKVYLHNEWQKAGLFEAIFACKWMWKINQEVSVGRYPIEEAKISPMAWEQILRWFVRRQYGLSDL